MKFYVILLFQFYLVGCATYTSIDFSYQSEDDFFVDSLEELKSIRQSWERRGITSYEIVLESFGHHLSGFQFSVKVVNGQYHSGKERPLSLGVAYGDSKMTDLSDLTYLAMLDTAEKSIESQDRSRVISASKSTNMLLGWSFFYAPPFEDGGTLRIVSLKYKEKGI